MIIWVDLSFFILHQVSCSAWQPLFLRLASRCTEIQFSVVHTLSGYYILIIARFVRGCAVFEGGIGTPGVGSDTVTVCEIYKSSRFYYLVIADENSHG